MGDIHLSECLRWSLSPNTQHTEHMRSSYPEFSTHHSTEDLLHREPHCLSGRYEMEGAVNEKAGVFSSSRVLSLFFLSCLGNQPVVQISFFVPFHGRACFVSARVSGRKGLAYPAGGSE